MPRPPRPSKTPSNLVARFFLWSAGTDLRVLERVPGSEAIKQIGYGTLVVVPAILAWCAMTYALSTLTENRFIYAAGGTVWAAIVFCFDRFIVSTFRKSESAFEDVTSTVFLSRLLFAVFVGVIVAHPLTMLYFDDTIEERLALDERRKLAEIGASFDAGEQAMDDRIAALKGEVRDRERERNEYQARLVDEIDGVISGRTTGIPGRGASAEEKKLQLEVAQRELEAARARNLVEIATLRSRVAAVRGERSRQLAEFRQSRDYLARAEALEVLADQSPHVNKVKWFLILFFVFVDTLPLLFKGFTPRGPYDDQLRLAEFKAERTVQAEHDSVERVLYPYMVMARENRFVSAQNYKGVRDYAQRYRKFLDEMARHQDEFLEEWRRQQQVLSEIDDERLRQTQIGYMETLRESSAEVVARAVDRFRQSLAWESRQSESGAEAT